MPSYRLGGSRIHCRVGIIAVPTHGRGRAGSSQTVRAVRIVSGHPVEVGVPSHRNRLSSSAGQTIAIIVETVSTDLACLRIHRAAGIIAVVRIVCESLGCYRHSRSASGPVAVGVPVRVRVPGRESGRVVVGSSPSHRNPRPHRTGRRLGRRGSHPLGCRRSRCCRRRSHQRARTPLPGIRGPRSHHRHRPGSTCQGRPRRVRRCLHRSHCRCRRRVPSRPA